VACSAFACDAGSKRWPLTLPSSANDSECGWLSIPSGPGWRFVSYRIPFPRDPLTGSAASRGYRLEFTAKAEGNTQLRAQLFDFRRSESLLLFHHSEAQARTYRFQFRIDHTNSDQIELRFSPSTFEAGGIASIRDVRVVQDGWEVRLPEISYIDGKAVRAVSQAGPLLLYQLLFGRLSGVPQRWNWSVDGEHKGTVDASIHQDFGTTPGPGSLRINDLESQLDVLPTPQVTLLGPVDETALLLTDPLIRAVGKSRELASEPWQFVIPTGVAYFRRFDRKRVFQGSERTTEQVASALSSYYDALAPKLARTWPTLSSDKLKAVFLINVAHQLWHYGNFDRLGVIGCVGAHERIRAADADGRIEQAFGGPIFTRTPRDWSDYIQSPIGCCSDQAFFLRVFLERFGLPTRRVYVPGHVTTEVNLDGSWQVVDATTNVIVTQPISMLYAGATRLVFAFPASHYRQDCVDCRRTSLGPNWLTFVPALGTPLAPPGGYEIASGFDAWEQRFLEGRTTFRHRYHVASPWTSVAATPIQTPR
jgi:hypothetical protein